jgi:hypothetical protein
VLVRDSASPSPGKKAVCAAVQVAGSVPIRELQARCFDGEHGDVAIKDHKFLFIGRHCRQWNDSVLVPRVRFFSDPLARRMRYSGRVRRREPERSDSRGRGCVDEIGLHDLVLLQIRTTIVVDEIVAPNEARTCRRALARERANAAFR